MAIIECPECHNAVSDQAPTCPHCGCPIKKETNYSSMEKNTIRQVNSEMKARHMVGIVCGILLVPISILAFVATAFEDVQQNSAMKTGCIVMGILCLVLGIFVAIYSIIKYREL